MKNMDWKDVAKRAGKTFVQAFVATAIVDIGQLMAIKDAESAKAVIAPILIAGLSASLSAAWNMLTNYFEEMEEE